MFFFFLGRSGVDRAGYLGPHVTAITVSETAVPRGLLTHRPFESLPLATRSPPRHRGPPSCHASRSGGIAGMRRGDSGSIRVVAETRAVGPDRTPRT
ncbi:hypothetical protein NL676_016548 [Syzygium grande]|nr:hypothetical protein NL676_016548 [Syzygium grande]